jgi:hypothetical protein
MNVLLVKPFDPPARIHHRFMLRGRLPDAPQAANRCQRTVRLRF